jgi:hypothetical protein
MSLIEEYTQKAITLLGPKKVSTIRKIEADRIISMHFTVGRYLRNELDLWHKDLQGVHPDEFSMKILENINKSK